MPTDVRTAANLLDRGLLNTSALVRALEPAAMAEEDEAPRGRALVTAVRDLISVVDRGDVGRFVDDLLGANSAESVAAAMIAEKYRQLGGTSGVLGNTAGAVSACPDGVGWFRHFQHGSIYWHPHTGAHEVHGVIRERWAALGWERSPLGYPTTDELIGKDPAGSGRVSHFQRGSLYWHSPALRLPVELAGAAATASAEIATRARGRDPVNVSALSAANIRGDRRPAVDMRPEVIGPSAPARQTVFDVLGAIRGRYLALGAEASVLGYPISDETPTADNIGRYNHFQAGSIFWTPGTGAHEVHGLIREMWAQSGWERNATLGYPITDELVPDRRVGGRRPESRRKRVAGLPADVIKLPATAITGRVQPSVVNLPMRLDVTNLDAATRTGLIEAGIVTHVEGVIGTFLSSGGVTTAAAEVSRNRFSDFENGVAFWERGASAAIRLQPWRKDGRSGPTLRLSEIVSVADSRLRERLASGTPGVQSVNFIGTSGYTHDGAGTLNRAHRLNVAIKGGVLLSVGAVVTFEPIQRVATLAITSWQPLSGVSTDLERALHQRLDPILWTTTNLLDLTDVSGDEPVAVLSVKTLPSGDVSVYLEPTGPTVRDVLTNGIRKAVTDIELIRPR